ncbi:hypothetical protein CWB41_00400 [Methylovirgula ligni]|nr:Crp/Fnr family transcriptional regulator [Methylovirgula ligni]QAY94386.1 hypothetical protein CWB41_00400 [Methylovirgula ligni]
MLRTAALPFHPIPCLSRRRSFHCQRGAMFLKHLYEGGRPCSACPAGYPPFCRSLVNPKNEHNDPRRLEVAQDFDVIEPHRNIYLRNARTDDIYVMCDGWAFTFLQTADGRRQIVSFLVGGDFFACELLIEQNSGLSLRTLTKSLFCRMPRAQVREQVLKSDETLNIVGKICIANERAKNDLLLDLGRRNADERVAHLILTLTERLDRLGTTRDGNYPFPLRQQDIADATGLTPVHVGRMISKFREFGWIELSAGHLRILNRGELVRLGRIELKRALRQLNPVWRAGSRRPFR